MKKLLLLIFSILISLTMQSQSWRTNADSLIVNQVFVDDVSRIDIFTFSEELTSADSIVLIDGTIIHVPYSNCYGYFIDIMPLANWSHTCKFCFVNASLEQIIITANLPPIDDNIEALSLHQRPNPNSTLVFFDTTFVRNCKSSDTDHKWAVLICGCGTETRFWFDLSSVYTVLTDVYGYQEAPESASWNGFEGRRVIATAPYFIKKKYIPYSDHGSSALNETDPEGIGDFFNWDDYDGNTIHSKQNIHNIFKCFSGDNQCLQNYREQGLQELTEEDQLFIYITGHGFNEYSDDTTSFFYVQEGQVNNYYNCPKIYDDTLISWLRNIKCSQMTLVMQNCYSGRFIEKFMDDISNPNCLCKNRVGLSAASANGVSWAENYSVYRESSRDALSNPFANEFTYYWTSAALGYYPIFKTKDNNYGFQVIDKGPWSANTRILGSENMNWIDYFNDYEQSYPHYPQFDINPDTDGDTIVSFSEMFEFANNLDSWSRQGYYYPYYNDTSIINFPSGYQPEVPQQQYESSFTKEAATLAGYEGQIDGVSNSGIATQPYRLCGDIWIGPDSELTMRDEVQSPENVKIYIKPSGKLLLDGAILTNLPEESSPMWQGVQVWGKKDKHQLQEDGRYWQGVLEMQNGAIISNAVIGVDIWNPDDVNSTGGIVMATDSRFINNGTALSFHPYENCMEHPLYADTMVIRNNVSFFKNCDFNIDEDYLGPSEFKMHVSLFQIRGVQFRGCNFRFRDNANSDTYPMGLFAYDAGFRMDGFCASGNQIYPCSVYDNSTFDGFYKAIVTMNDGIVGVRPITVTNTDFINNSFGVYALKSGYTTILNSIFRIGQDSTQCAAGIFVENTPVFTIEQDTFCLAQQYPNENYGVVVKNSKSQNLVYKNMFRGLYCANLSEGRNNTWMTPRNTTNAKTRILGLEYHCNDNADNWCDFYVCGGGYANTNGIQPNQGSENDPANNTFSQGCYFQFINHGDYGINYYYDPELINVVPTSNYAVNLEVAKVSNNCPSHYGIGGNSYNDTLMPILSDVQRIQREIDYYDSYTAYNNIKTIYDGLIDGGNTEAEILDIQIASPSDLWALRTQLLGHSPYLTDGVLINMLERDDIFPQSVLFEILASNPDELKRDALMAYLRNMDNPMPEYMLALLQQMTNGVTVRTAMESQLAKYSREYRQAAGDIIRDILSDTIIDKTALVGWLGNMEDIESDREIVSIYLEDGKFTDAIALANLFPSLYGLTGEDLVEHNDYMTLIHMYQDLNQEGRNIMQLDSTEYAIVEHIADCGIGVPKAMAKSIMLGVYGYQYDDCPNGVNIYPTRKEENKESDLSNEEFNRAMGFHVEMSPNPASTWVNVSYTLPVGFSEAQLKITNFFGVIMAIYDLHDKDSQRILDLRDLSPGVYIYTAYCGKHIQTGKLVILQ